MKLYKIRNWDSLFENNRSRELKALNWTVLPNAHDGATYSHLITQPDGPEMFAAWVLIVQVASKCDPRGTLLRDDRTPMTPMILSLKTRAPVVIFEKCLKWLELNSDWIEVLDVEVENQHLTSQHATIPHHAATIPHDVTKKGREENGMEQKGMEGGRFSPPDTLEANAYGVEIGISYEEVEKFLNHHGARGWILSRGLKMKDWKKAMLTWKSNIGKFTGTAKNENTRNAQMGITPEDAKARASRRPKLIEKRLAEFKQQSLLKDNGA